jgi:hypothetical protein
MLDDLNARDGEGTSGRERPVRAPEFAQPLADREVPLNAVTAADDVVNRWLDGDAPEPVALRGDAARHVDFWKHVNAETERRRRMVTPAHLAAQIMEALPGVAMAHAEPWYRKELHLSPVTAMAAAAGLLALGAALVALLG